MLTLGPILLDAAFLKIGRVAFFQKMPARKHPSGFRERRLRRDAVRAASKGNTLSADYDQFLLAVFSPGRNFSVQLLSPSYPGRHEARKCNGKRPDLENLHGTA